MHGPIVVVAALSHECPDRGRDNAALTCRRTRVNFDKEFDASGLACPMPIVKTKKALSDMTPGQVLRVLTTDPGSVSDMAAFAEQTGNPMLQSGEEGGKFVFFLRKG
jgi:tRNA 2-thiouridine synthesizing protein A